MYLVGVIHIVRAETGLDPETFQRHARWFDFRWNLYQLPKFWADSTWLARRFGRFELTSVVSYDTSYKHKTTLLCSSINLDKVTSNDSIDISYLNYDQNKQNSKHAKR